MNVQRTQRCNLSGGLVCVYKLVGRDPITGDSIEYGCSLRGGDFYNIYPEFNEQGNIVNQDPNPTVPSDFKLGPTVIWENITNQHQDGMNFDFRTFQADIHPLYHVEHRNVPIKPRDGEDPLGEVFGGREPVLVSSGWVEDTYYGHDRVERCRFGIYGKKDFRSNLVRPKAARSYVGQIKDWINFSSQPVYGQAKEFFACEESDESIQKLCERWFDAKVAKRVSEAIIYIKNGGYVNLWKLLENNFVDNEYRKNFMRFVSTKCKFLLYKGNVNIEFYFRLYDHIGKMEWKHEYVDENGNKVQTVVKLPKEVVKLWRQNILNFVMNYPPLQKSPTNKDTGYRTNERYWWAVMMFKRAMDKKDPVANMKLPLPEWFIKQYKDTGKHDPVIEIHGEKKLWSEANQLEKDDFLEAKIVRVQNASDLYPKMERIEDIIDYHKKGPMWDVFCDILKAGRRWNRTEIQSAWDVFQNSYINDNPAIFWDWVEELACRPMEDEMTIDGKEVLREGAMRLDLGEGNISASRSFASNLIGLRTCCKKDSYDINKMPPQDWYEAKGKSKPGVTRNPKDCFWDLLAKSGGLIDDRYIGEHYMGEQDYKEATLHIDEHIEEERGLSDFNIYEARSLSLDTGFSDSDFSQISMYDVDNDDLHPLREEDPWLDEE